ncbi:MAG: class C beta-lactamase-related serine hydrolase [Spirochaetaceae bacterium]|nr:MAG: class C beta-lactamase-related serine hydrolase [Spirochaetaceae bacterium]
MPLLALSRLFADDRRAESFRVLHRLLPSRSVAPTGSPWPFSLQKQPLPATYPFAGEDRCFRAFLERTETTGLLVAQDGVIVHESYASGYDEATLVSSFSVAKSITSVLIGIAIDRGAIGSVDDPVSDYVPELAQGGYAGATIRDLLSMSSGVEWSEDYRNPRSDVMRLPVRLFALRQSTPSVLARLPRGSESGTLARYSSADTLVLGLVLERSTGMHLAGYLEEALWRPAGMAAPAAWGTDRHGHALAHAFLGATLRDYARFGRLILHRGRRDGVQVVPAEWVDASLTPGVVPLGDDPSFGEGFDYGYHWWLPPDDRNEAVAMGIHGQFVYVHRGFRVVIVKTGTDPDYAGRELETVAAFRAIGRSLIRG